MPNSILTILEGIFTNSNSTLNSNITTKISLNNKMFIIRDIPLLIQIYKILLCKIVNMINVSNYLIFIFILESQVYRERNKYGETYMIETDK